MRMDGHVRRRTKNNSTIKGGCFFTAPFPVSYQPDKFLMTESNKERDVGHMGGGNAVMSKIQANLRRCLSYEVGIGYGGTGNFFHVQQLNGFWT